MLKIMGRDTSSNVQKVLWVCGELGLEYEREDLGGPFGGNDRPEYLAINPNGRVPTIDDDGYILWESNSIVRYLAAKHGGDPLSPSDLQVRGHAERWMDWQIATMSPAMVPVFWGLVRTPPEKRDADAIEAARMKLSGLFAIMDAQLSKTQFLASDDFTIADIPLGIAGYRWFVMDMERENYTNLKRWYDALTERKAFQDAVMKPLA